MTRGRNPLPPATFHSSTERECLVFGYDLGMVLALIGLPFLFGLSENSLPGWLKCQESEVASDQAT